MDEARLESDDGRDGVRAKPYSAFGRGAIRDCALPSARASPLPWTSIRVGFCHFSKLGRRPTRVPNLLVETKLGRVAKFARRVISRKVGKI
jgi:hypothetical protein